MVVQKGEAPQLYQQLWRPSLPPLLLGQEERNFPFLVMEMVRDVLLDMSVA